MHFYHSMNNMTTENNNSVLFLTIPLTASTINTWLIINRTFI